MGLGVGVVLMGLCVEYLLVVVWEEYEVGLV